MSHLTTVKGEVRSRETLERACERLGQGQTKAFGKPRYLFDYHLAAGRRVTGQAVQLPGWYKPVVFDTETGEIHYDNYNGNWGNIEELHKFLDEYQLQAVMDVAQEQGHQLEVRRTEDEIQFQIYVPG